MRDFMDLFSLKGKKAIVTGGTRGLGYGMAEGLCRAGAEVAILGTSEKVRESADALARTTGVVVHGIVGDLVREEEVPNIYKRLVESLDGQADILVNCAGVQHRCVAEDFPMEEWNRILRVNLGAMFQMSQLAARDMLQRGYGRIINVASMEQQRVVARTHDVIMDGRDIGTVVLPDADVKIFLSASPEVRARRRWLELPEKGAPDTYEAVLADLIARDERDSNRAIAPLRPADDAVLLDTSGMTLQESIDAILKLIRKKVTV